MTDIKPMSHKAAVDAMVELATGLRADAAIHVAAAFGRTDFSKKRWNALSAAYEDGDIGCLQSMRDMVAPKSLPCSGVREIGAIRIRSEFRALAERFDEEDNAAFDLWTWLPCYIVATELWGDCAPEVMPSTAWVMKEASTLICALFDELGDERFGKVREELAAKIRKDGWIEAPEVDDD